MRYHCTTCAGKGVFTPPADGGCPHCKGSGRDPGPVRAGQPCAVCRGSGRLDRPVDCPDCGGQGYTE